MPSGATHDRFWRAGWGITLPASLYSSISVSPSFASGYLFGYGLGYYFDPDMDQVSITQAEGRLMRHFKILGYVIVGYTTIYGAVFRKLHRSFITHFPYISTGIRFVYLFWWLYFIPILWEVWMLEFWVGVYFGMSQADAGHSTADLFFQEEGDKLVWVKNPLGKFNPFLRKKKKK